MQESGKNIHDLNIEVKRLLSQCPIEHADYYSISLFADDSGKFRYSVYGHWAGFADESRKIELREPSLVQVELLLKYYRDIQEPAFVINSERDLVIFAFVLGGHAAIEKSIAEKYLAHVLRPTPHVYTYDSGLVNADSLKKEVFNRAPNPKLRMKIMTRDHRRCKICGASPSNNEHVELQLHHIQPYSLGGLTTENNLITLCHTCHKGLEPHVDYSLFEEIGVGLFSSVKSEEKYVDKIKRNIKFGLEKAKKKGNCK